MMPEVQENAVQLLSDDVPVADVMFDQLEFLVDHSAQCGNPHCSECGRYQVVRQFLMMPFADVEFRVSIG